MSGPWQESTDRDSSSGRGHRERACALRRTPTQPSAPSEIGGDRLRCGDVLTGERTTALARRSMWQGSHFACSVRRRLLWHLKPSFCPQTSRVGSVECGSDSSNLIALPPQIGDCLRSGDDPVGVRVTARSRMCDGTSEAAAIGVRLRSGDDPVGERVIARSRTSDGTSEVAATSGIGTALDAARIALRLLSLPTFAVAPKTFVLPSNVVDWVGGVRLRSVNLVALPNRATADRRCSVALVGVQAAI